MIFSFCVFSAILCHNALDNESNNFLAAVVLGVWHSGGDPDARCNATTGRCDCKDWYYSVHAQAVCNCVVSPVDCTVALSVDVDDSGHEYSPKTQLTPANRRRSARERTDAGADVDAGAFF